MLQKKISQCSVVCQRTLINKIRFTAGALSFLAVLRCHFRLKIRKMTHRCRVLTFSSQLATQERSSSHFSVGFAEKFRKWFPKQNPHRCCQMAQGIKDVPASVPWTITLCWWISWSVSTMSRWRCSWPSSAFCSSCDGILFSFTSPEWCWCRLHLNLWQGSSSALMLSLLLRSLVSTVFNCWNLEWKRTVPLVKPPWRKMQIFWNRLFLYRQ